MTRRLHAIPIVRVATACALLLAVALPARAVDAPLDLRTEVTDQADVLSAADEAEVAAALKDLRDRTSIQLFVAYIDTTGGETVTAFTTDTAAASSLGGNDALILVAIDDRSDSMWVGPKIDAITTEEIDSILVDTLEPKLAEGDFAGAMIAAAEATGEAATSAPVPTTAPVTAPPATAAATPAATAAPGSGTGSGSGSPGGGFDITPILAFLLVAGGLLLLGRWFIVRRAADKVRKQQLDALNSDANRALLAADEALKDAGNDVDFAAAQWGDQEVVPYRDAIRQADEELRASFALRQKLDDAYPEKSPERDAMLREIVARCTKAHQLLDEQEARFDALQDLQKAAPAQLAALPAAIDALLARRAAADQALARLRASYTPSAIGSVDGNLAEATKALDAASAEATRGAAVVTTKPADGVVALRRVQEAMARATQLVEAVERLAASLDDAARRLAGELDAAAKDVAGARAAVGRLAQVPAVPPVAPGVTAPGTAPAADPASALRAAEAALDEAHAAAGARPLDPLAALQLAVAANQAADAIVAQVADVQAQTQRRRQAADTSIATAQAHVTRANDYITTRRHGVGEPARTRAAEAALRLDEARSLLAANPEGAAASANRAIALADEAYRLAAGEFDGWNQGGGPVAGPYAGPDVGSQVVGAVLGGILGGILSGGGRGGSIGSGWGGSPWGGSGGSSAGGFGLPRGPVGGRTRGGGFNFPMGGGGFGGGGGGGGGGRVRGGRW